MCGYFGLVDFGGAVTPGDHHEIKAGADAQRHRGPDDHAFDATRYWCAGFRRLSIIDLSAPSQPYVNEAGTVHMMCNGEIYNHRRLRVELQDKGHAFSTQCDVEVILHGYEEYGEQIFDRLNGMFSAVVWDEAERVLVLARDRMGIKPLHYLVQGSRAYFSTDYNAFRHQSHTGLSFNENAILSYLSFRYVIGEQTFFKEVRDLLPGHVLRMTPDGPSVRQFWDIPIGAEADRGEAYYIEELGRLLGTAVERRLMSDVPVGAFISGGLDSSVLLSYLAELKPDAHTFVAGFPHDNYNEFRYAQIVGDAMGFDPQLLMLEQSEYIAAMEEVLEFRGEPTSVPHEAAFMMMSRFMKKDITVVLSGEGADELFGGYGRIFRSPFDYYKQRWLDRLPVMSGVASRLLRSPVEHAWPDPMSHFLWRYSWFTSADKHAYLRLDRLGDTEFDAYSLEYLGNLFDRAAGHDYYHGMFYIQGKIHVVNLLNRLDRMTMAAGVEARVPFLDHEVVELASRMPVRHKLRWRSWLSRLRAIPRSSETISERLDIPKYVLKRAAEGRVPREIIERKKMGFPVPLDDWMSMGLRERARDVLLDDGSAIGDLLRKDELDRFLSQKHYQSAYDYDGKKIWMLMNLELWRRGAFA